MLYIRWVHVCFWSICNVGSLFLYFRACSRYWCYTEKYEIMAASMSWKTIFNLVIILKIEAFVCLCVCNRVQLCVEFNSLYCRENNNFKKSTIRVRLLTHNGYLLEKVPLNNGDIFKKRLQFVSMVTQKYQLLLHQWTEYLLINCTKIVPWKS